MVYLPGKLADRFRNFYFYFSPFRDLAKLVDLTRKNKPLPIPKFVICEATNSCNNECSKCPNAGGLGRPKTNFDVGLFENVVGQLAPGTVITLHHTGEPTLHPRIFDLIKIARDAGMYTQFSTNASMLPR